MLGLVVYRVPQLAASYLERAAQTGGLELTLAVFVALGAGLPPEGVRR